MKHISRNPALEVTTNEDQPMPDDLRNCDFNLGMTVEFLRWAVIEPSLVAAFSAETGIQQMPAPKNGLEAMIDEATGAREHFLKALTVWLIENQWGWDSTPDSLRKMVLDFKSPPDRRQP